MRSSQIWGCIDPSNEKKVNFTDNAIHIYNYKIKYAIIMFSPNGPTYGLDKKRSHKLQIRHPLYNSRGPDISKGSGAGNMENHSEMGLDRGRKRTVNQEMVSSLLCNVVEGASNSRDSITSPPSQNLLG